MKAILAKGALPDANNWAKEVLNYMDSEESSPTKKHYGRSVLMFVAF